MTRHGDDYASDDEVAAADQIQNASAPGSTREIVSEKELQAIYEDFQNGAGFVWRDTWQNANRGTVNGFRRLWKGYKVRVEGNALSQKAFVRGIFDLRFKLRHARMPAKPLLGS